MPGSDKILTIDEVINLCHLPGKTSCNFLPALLKVFVAKLNLHGTIFSVPSTGDNLPSQSRDVPYDVEIQVVLKGGEQKPIDIKALKLKPIEVEKAGVVSTFVKISGNISEGKYTENVRHPEIGVIEDKIETAQRNLEKVGTVLNKMVKHNEHLTKRVQLLAANTLSQTQSLAIKNSLTTQTDLNFDFYDANVRQYSSSDCMCKKELDDIRKEHTAELCELTKKVAKMEEKLNSVDDRVTRLDDLKKFLEQITTRDQMHALREKVDFICCEISKFRKEISHIKNHVEDLSDCVQFTEKRIKEIQKSLELLKKIRELCDQVEKLNIWKKKVHEEHEKFTEITEYLKTTKANREELDYLFEEKADRDELLKLVTFEFFKSVQDDLSSGIVQVLEQLMRNEIEWERAHREIQLMMDVKADSCEVTSLKRYINCKLDIVQKKLNDLIRNRLTAHAAAVKIRLLQDARCITCTAEADINQLQYPIHMLQSLKKSEVKCICEPSKRYCGGEHTVLAPDQKYIYKRKPLFQSSTATTSNFTETKGKDGNLYRTRLRKCICDTEEDQKEMRIN